jgi:hypothetical protein
MPHSIASKQKMIQRCADKFNDELRKTLRNDEKKFQHYHNTVKKLRSSEAPREIVIKKINDCMKKYPALCNKVVGFHPDGKTLLRETESTITAPTVPPGFFTADIVSCVVPLLSFPVIGTLAKTCKWMNATITQAQVEEALKRARDTFGKVTLSTEFSTGRDILSIFNTRGEKLEIKQLNARSKLFHAKMNGKAFIGESMNHWDHPRPFGDICNLITYIKSMDAGRGDKPVAWFKTEGTFFGADDSFYANFCQIADGEPIRRGFGVLFEELRM